MNRLLFAAAAMLLIAAGAQAAQGNAPDKGQGKAQNKAQAEAPAQVQGKGPPPQEEHGRNHDEHAGGGKDKDKSGDKDKGAAGDNRGQVVSECNHRANERKLKGLDRKEYVDWCVDRGEKYKYDDRRYSYDRNCYQQADRKGLTDVSRSAFLGDCLKKSEGDYDRDMKRERDKAREQQSTGKDVLHKAGDTKK